MASEQEITTRPPDYMDVKAASEVAEELRGRVRHMAANYRAFRGRKGSSLKHSRHLLMEDNLLRAQLSDMFALYRQVNRDYLKMYRECLADLRATPFARQRRQQERQGRRLCA